MVLTVDLFAILQMYRCQTVDLHGPFLSRIKHILCQRGITYRCANNDNWLIDAELSLKQVMKMYGLSMLTSTSSNVQSMAVENGAVFQEK